MQFKSRYFNTRRNLATFPYHWFYIFSNVLTVLSRKREQPQSTEASIRPTSLLEQTPEEPIAENTYQETSMRTAPNQNDSDQRNGRIDTTNIPVYAAVNKDRNLTQNVDQKESNDVESASVQSYEYATVSKDRREVDPSESYAYAYATGNNNRSNVHDMPKEEGQYAYASVPDNRSRVHNQKPVNGGGKDDEEGWMDNSIYNMNEGRERGETEGWEDNVAYVTSSVK